MHKHRNWAKGKNYALGAFIMFSTDYKTLLK